MIITLPLIIFPVKGLEVMEIIFSSLRNRQNMINFPTELAILPKGRFNHQSAAIILPEFVWVRSAYGMSFCPNGINNGSFKWLAKFIRIPFPFHVHLPLFPWSKISLLSPIISCFDILALFAFQLSSPFLNFSRSSYTLRFISSFFVNQGNFPGNILPSFRTKDSPRSVFTQRCSKLHPKKSVGNRPHL